MQRGFRCNIAGKLRQIGLAHNDQTGGFIALNQLVIALRNIAFSCTATKGHGSACIGWAIILQQNRDTAERPFWQCFKLLFGLIAHFMNDSVKLRIAPINRCKCFLNGLARRQNFGANGLSQTDRVSPDIIKRCRRHGIIPM